MIVNGYTMNSRAHTMLSCVARHPCLPRFPTNVTLPNIREPSRSHDEANWHCPAAVSSSYLSAVSTPLLSGEHGGLSRIILLHPKRRRYCMVPRASKDTPFTVNYRFPAMTKKPRWWWRTLACIPYLMPLHETWMHAKTAYHLMPFLEDFEFATYPFFQALGSLPSWVFIVYFMVAYLGIVRRREWPHFLRFHLVMSMLLEIGYQAIGIATSWLPPALYWGKLGMHFWTFMAFSHLFTVVECMKCALRGMYADVPFVCDAAYIQIPYE
ncbi:hypothetical protein Cgig2_024655 [Carnegiea gigantea]|uniref:Protein TIC 20 n=1 Tax=Carnegiea gigantea TaxID=171969 RepID=A0A9Q1K743_9CARY|nr:hypothetical protein Cgig2_024655 [Carnegiea gigantea]